GATALQLDCEHARPDACDRSVGTAHSAGRSSGFRLVAASNGLPVPGPEGLTQWHCWFEGLADHSGGPAQGLHLFLYYPRVREGTWRPVETMGKTLVSLSASVKAGREGRGRNGTIPSRGASPIKGWPCTMQRDRRLELARCCNWLTLAWSAPVAG